MRVEGGPKGPSWVHQPLVEVEVEEIKGFVQFTLVKVSRAWSLLLLGLLLIGQGLCRGNGGQDEQGLNFTAPPAGFWKAMELKQLELAKASGRVCRSGGGGWGAAAPSSRVLSN